MTTTTATNFTHLFHAPRNRVELISDFPDGNDAEVGFPTNWICFRLGLDLFSKYLCISCPGAVLPAAAPPGLGGPQQEHLQVLQLSKEMDQIFLA